MDLLSEATATFDGWHRAMLLAKLVPHLDTARLREVVALLPQLPVSARLSLIPALVAHLDADQREAVVRSVMAMPAGTRAVVTDLLPYLTPAQRDVAVADAVRQLSDASDVKNALFVLAPHLTGAELATALGYVQRTVAPGQRVAALTGIAGHLSREQRTEALNLALQLEDGNAVAYELGKLAPHLGSEQLERAVAAANRLPHAGHRASHRPTTYRNGDRPRLKGPWAPTTHIDDL